MIGQKGVPATHGGVERHVEELGARLAAMGHEVVVFTRPNYTDPELREYRGMKLRSLPTIGSKHLDAIVHSALATLACWSGGYDVVHYHAIGPCLVAPLARLRGRKVVATIHGQDWRRAKWGRGASAMLRLSEWMALHVPHVTISVSETLAQRYRARGAQVVYVPNGVSTDPGDDVSALDEFGLQDARYVLYAGRLVPEKGAHYLLDAWAEASHDGSQLVIAGDSSNTDGYVAQLHEHRAQDVVFTGYEYGARLAALFRHAALFVLPSDLEGLPLVLLEALAYGTPVLASDIAPNEEVLGEAGTYFAAGDVSSLAERLTTLLADVPRLKERSRALADDVVRRYDWDTVAAQVDRIYRDLLSVS